MGHIEAGPLKKGVFPLEQRGNQTVPDFALLDHLGPRYCLQAIQEGFLQKFYT